MKADGKYRFGLGFKADTQERIQVGDFLNGLGNKKSDVVVRAVAEYIVNHPEIAEPERVHVLAQPRITQEDVKRMVAEYMSNYTLPMHSVSNAGECVSIDTLSDSDPGIDAMLSNLDIFII